MKILMIDDGRGSAHIIRVMLQDEGHQIKLARDARDAYLTDLLSTPDLVITGIQEAQIGGLRLTDLMRINNPALKVIYTVCCCAHAEAAMEEQRTKARVIVLQKPFSKSELMKVISDLAGLGTATGGHQPLKEGTTRQNIG